MGRAAVKGETYALLGDLGVGKTVFTQGFAHGLGITEPVNSTFTILQVYDKGRIPCTILMYRIADPEEMFRNRFDDYISGDGACLPH